MALIDPAGKPVYLRNERVGDTHIVVFKNAQGTYAKANVLFRAGDKLIHCWGTQSSANKTLKLESAGEWFAKVCGTLRVK